MKKFLVLFLALAIVAGFSAVSWAGIEGSVHDLRTETGANGQICIVCHAPHGNQSVFGAPLWNHAVTAQTFTMYSSDSLDAVVPGDLPDGNSKLCMSCHDGVTSIDAFGGSTGSRQITGDANLTTDLSDDHPISFVYNAALATTDGALENPESATVTIGTGGDRQATGTIEEVMLSGTAGGATVECSSCHSVHNDFVAGGAAGTALLKIQADVSAICQACHLK